MNLRRDDYMFFLLALLCLPATFMEHGTWKMAVNPLPTLWLAWLAWRHTRERFGLTLTLGVVCGAIGDALLAPVQESLFLPGVIAFFVGHCFYIAAFLRGTGLRPGRRLVALPLAAYAVTMAFIVHAAMQARGEGELFTGVAAYLALLTATTFIGIARNGSPLVGAGVFIFLVSDSHIALNNIILAQPLDILVFSGMTTYYIAQYLIIRGGINENAATPAQLRS